MSETDPSPEPSMAGPGSDEGTGLLLERLRSLQLWANHLEDMLARRTEQAEIWRRRAEERKERIARLESRSREGWIKRLRRRLRDSPAPSPATTPAAPIRRAEPELGEGRSKGRVIHPTVAVGIVSDDPDRVPPLLKRLNGVAISQEADAARVMSLDLLVVVGDGGVALADRFEETRSWLAGGHPAISVLTSSPQALSAGDIAYFDESHDVFNHRPSDSFGLDPELHPTLARLGPEARELIDLPDDDALGGTALERMAAARLRVLRSASAPRLVAERLLAAGGARVPGWRAEALAVLLTRRPDFAVEAVQQLIAQTYRPMRVAVGLHCEAGQAEGPVRQMLETSGLPHTIESLAEGISQGQCMNILTEGSPGEVVLKIDDDDLYAPTFVDDMVNSLWYSGADIIGKASAFVRLREGGYVLLRDDCYSPVSHVVGPTITAHRGVWDEVRFPNRADRVDSKFLQAAGAAGYRIVSHHPWDFCVVRHDRGHSWTASDAFFSSTGLPVDLTWETIQTPAVLDARP